MTLKAMQEKHNDLVEQMQNCINKAKAEKRDLNSSEVETFDKLKTEARELKEAIEREEKKMAANNTNNNNQTVEERDIHTFAEFVRNSALNLETRGDVNLTKGDNGAVIPTTIANKIIEKVKEISPIYNKATKYKVKGSLWIPVEDTTTEMSVAYATEFSDLESTSNKFSKIELTGFLYGVLTKISRSLINNSDFALTNWIINKMATKVARFIEGECLNGTENKVAGILGSYDSTNMKIQLAGKTSPTADELIDIQDTIPDIYQSKACWIMNKATRTAIRKLKDGEGQYLLQKDFTAGGTYTLLGKPVYISDNVEPVGANQTNKAVIIYGDMSGLAVKEAESFEMQILKEKYASQHAIGIVGWGEIDAKVENTEKIAVAYTDAD